MRGLASRPIQPNSFDCRQSGELSRRHALKINTSWNERIGREDDADFSQREERACIRRVNSTPESGMRPGIRTDENNTVSRAVREMREREMSKKKNDSRGVFLNLSSARNTIPALDVLARMTRVASVRVSRSPFKHARQVCIIMSERRHSSQASRPRDKNGAISDFRTCGGSGRCGSPTSFRFPLFLH